eukprot:Skav205863  [mRNA]  locus=scaffold766:152556:152957:+ [translate_table: standard]
MQAFFRGDRVFGREKWTLKKELLRRALTPEEEDENERRVMTRLPFSPALQEQLRLDEERLRQEAVRGPEWQTGDEIDKMRFTNCLALAIIVFGKESIGDLLRRTFRRHGTLDGCPRFWVAWPVPAAFALALQD